MDVDKWLCPACLTILVNIHSKRIRVHRLVTTPNELEKCNVCGAHESDNVMITLSEKDYLGIYAAYGSFME